ncbi:GAF domain-containing protein [Gemmata sp.]|uniref:GAF domain-containing protein n=1 Tax=Gemmata sp. TaxID=1914242 RepID=UPI003F70AC83
MSEATPLSPAPTTCEDEPVHAPGAVQPFGVLLAMDPTSLVVRHASANSNEALGPDAPSPIGATAADLLGPAAEEALRAALAGDGLVTPRPIPVSPRAAGPRPWHGVAHALGALVFVELEPADEHPASPVAWLSAVRAAVEHLAAAATTAEFCAAAARHVRALTGYDRVMVYRFDADWNGEVVGEERHADLEPFLGLHYPASDIPARTRALFLANRVRVIPDAAAEPVPVAPDRDGRTGLPLDLGRCLLRAVAPVHREYMRNMGVRASLTASLVVGGRLWGLIACHHATPRRPGPAEREACDLLARVASGSLAHLADAEDRAHLAALAAALKRVEARARVTAPPIAALANDATDLLALVGAAGAVVWRAGREVLIGRTPPAGAIPGLVGWVRAAAAPLVATDRLGGVHAPAREFAGVASGLLALEVSREADEYVLWFRPELLRAVTWGGDPHARPDAGGRASPRRSFAAWQETVRGCSAPWRPAEVENAGRVREVLLAAGAGSVARLEALLPICAWCKKVRDEPGYWRGVEEFVRDLVDVRFTHGVCPECFDRQVEELADEAAGGGPNRRVHH